MIVEVISIGDELLIGQTVNTNASWIGEELSQRGFDVSYGVVVKDTEEVIIEAVDVALKRAELVIVTGGLGPTKDDITKHTLCKYFDTELEINPVVLDRVKSFFSTRDLEMLDVNIQQAALPKIAKVLDNDIGTASGMWFDVGDKVLISLPGVPYEMKHILNHSFDLLIQKFSAKAFYAKTILFQGIGESYLAEEIKDIETEIRDNKLGIAYLPSPGLVRLRVYGNSVRGEIEKVDSYAKRIVERIPKHAFGESGTTLSEVVGDLLKKEKLSLGTVESFTSGGLASEIVKTSGASSYFNGSIVSYSNEVKTGLVGVDANVIREFGVVSEEVVHQMAQFGREKLNVDYCISTSGIAGPDGGTDELPVGKVCIGIASVDEVKTWTFQFGKDRMRNTEITISTALNLLRLELLSLS